VQITSTLTHPNTIAVYDYGRAEDGSLYYVMEYLEGLDLQALVTRFGPLPCERVIHMLRQLCGSLGEAHARGLVHRDIKPANLLVCARGGVADTLKVLDFGVAHVMRAARIRVGNEKVLIGTPEYMAPEVLESTGQASPQTDLYAVGAVGYFLLTGRPPFEAETTQELCLAHLTATPQTPSRVLGQAVDPVLERAVMLCLSKRRQARPTSAEALGAMLSRSELALSWSGANAESWWASHAAEVEIGLGSESRSNSTAPSAVRPSMLG
jgi:eukaryotic-like serine/threonine-protein kinase